jgi:hypothetical protein
MLCGLIGTLHDVLLSVIVVLAEQGGEQSGALLESWFFVLAQRVDPARRG